MKLRKLHIEDYKMFKDFDISFVDENDEALPIIVLAGVNGSGKTSLLEYIYKTFEYSASKLDGELLLDTSSVKDSILPNPFKIRGHISKTFSLSRYEPDIAIEQSHLLFNAILYILVGQDNIDNLKESILEHYRRLSREYSHIEALNKIQKFLNTIFTDDMDITFVIEDIDIVLRDNEKVIFKNKNGDTFNIEQLSTGEKTLLSKVLYLYFKDYKDKVILIDEPELSLHPSWQNKVLKIYENFAKQNNCQIIIATHSSHIIGSAKNEYLRILRKKEDGSIEAISDLKAHGRDINSILFDVMGEVDYRPLKEFDDKIDRLFYEIDERNLEKAKQLLEDLKQSYGDKDTNVMEATMLIEMFERE